jgi:hypothetical protein
VSPNELQVLLLGRHGDLLLGVAVLAVLWWLAGRVAPRAGRRRL